MAKVLGKPSADDVKRVAVAALVAALDDSKEKARKKPGLTGVRAVATGAVLYTAGRAVIGGRRFIREHMNGTDDGEAEAEGDDGDYEDEPRDEADEDFDEEDEGSEDEPRAEDDEDFDDEEPEAEEDEDFEDDDYDDEPRAEDDEDYDDEDEVRNPADMPPVHPERETAGRS
jgi:hypothetical protein